MEVACHTGFAPAEISPLVFNGRVATHFGNFLRDLREFRGITRQRFADLAEVSLSTIQTGEGQATCEWKRSSRVRVLRALKRLTPPATDQEIKTFTALAKLSDSQEAIQALEPVIAAALRPLHRSGLASSSGFQQLAAGRRFAELLEAPQRAAFERFIDAMEVVGPDALTRMCEVLVSTAESARTAAVEEHKAAAGMMVVHPPQVQDGHSVQQVNTPRSRVNA